MTKQANKAVKRQRGAGIDIWEARYVVGGREMRRNGKRDHNRAQRRLNKALIAEQRGS
jgi:hypothetical protein